MRNYYYSLLRYAETMNKKPLSQTWKADKSDTIKKAGIQRENSENLVRFSKENDIMKTSQIQRKNRENTNGKQTVETADGHKFESDKKYWFYDSQMKQIRSTIGLRPEGLHLYSFGFKVVRVDRLRELKENAVSDAKCALSDEIAEIENLMLSLD